jgi:hypothetical protein
MRRAVSPAIPPSMYRHFAIVTVVLAAGLAMLAEGENREAQAAPAVQVAKPAAPPALITANPTNGSMQASGWSDVDFDSGFDGSAEGTLSGGDSGLPPDLEEETVHDHARGGLVSLSEQERELLLGGLQERALLEAENHNRRSGPAPAGD